MNRRGFHKRVLAAVGSVILGGEGTYRHAFRQALRPTRPVTVSEWADRHRFLSQKASAEPGRWRTARTPYLREIMDTLSVASRVTEVTFKKGAQVGGTEAGNNWIGYVIAHAPGPMMMVQPSLDLAKRHSKSRLDPLIEESPELAGRVSPMRSRNASSTVLQKDFPNGTLVIAGANSAAGLRSMPVRFLFLDEVDAYPGNLEEEGDPVNLAEARTRTFKAKRKVFKVSTPTIQGRSRIEVDWEASDQSEYHVPCPHCGNLAPLKWRQMRWTKESTDQDTIDAILQDETRVWYVCLECDGEIREHHKGAMLEGGEWVAKFPARSSFHRGFHLSALYSPVGWYSWAEAVVAFLKAKDRPDALRVWVNTVLGETYKQKGETPEWEDLYNRRESYKVGEVPNGGLVLTAGADVQKDRIELEIVAWGVGKESWSVDYVVLDGDPFKPEVWEKLREVLSRPYRHASGVDMGIRMLAVDSGYATQDVYKWVRTQAPNRVVAVKGRETGAVLVGAAMPVDVTVRGKKLKRGLRVWPVETGTAKEELYGWLRMKPPTHPERDGYPPGWCHLPQYGEEWFKMLTAEQVVPRIVRGYRRYQWEKIRERNEALDCRVYARAAAAIVGIDRWREEDWEAARLAVGSSAPRAAAASPPKRKKRERWIDRGRSTR